MGPAPQRHMYENFLRQNLKKKRPPDSIETGPTNQSQITVQTPYMPPIEMCFYLP